jgi:hypothetical protein
MSAFRINCSDSESFVLENILLEMGISYRKEDSNNYMSKYMLDCNEWEYRNILEEMKPSKHGQSTQTRNPVIVFFIVFVFIVMSIVLLSCLFELTKMFMKAYYKDHSVSNVIDAFVAFYLVMGGPAIFAWYVSFRLLKKMITKKTLYY